MTDETRLWLLILVVALTNGITAATVYLYWQDRFYQLLRAVSYTHLTLPTTPYV